MNEYMGATNDRVQVRDGFREMCGDILFNIPARIVAKHHKGKMRSITVCKYFV